MDRQAWIAVTLCAIGLVFYTIYTAQHAPPRVAPALPTPAPEFSPAPSASPNETNRTSAPTAEPSPTAAPTFEEKFETLRNSDVELRLTNRGGGISEVRLLHHRLEKDRDDVVLNSPDRLPIGAIVENPAEPALAEYTFTKLPDGGAQYEGGGPPGLTMRKRFSFPAQQEAKDNYVVEMEVDFRNDDAQAHGMRDFFVGLGSTAAIHSRDLPQNTRLVWCVNGSARGTDVNWFSAQKYPLVGVEKRAAMPVFQEKVNAAGMGRGQ